MISWNEYENILAYRELQLRKGADNSAAHCVLSANLRRALEEELTPRQHDLLIRYYIDGLTMSAIAEEFSLNVSTVSRTIARARRRLCKCMRYGAKELIEKVT